MVPPFLAYYGVLTNNQTLAQLAYDQCRLYRSYLVDDDADGMWKHITLGSFSDDGHWSTGMPFFHLFINPIRNAHMLGLWVRKRLGCSRHAARARDHPALPVRAAHEEPAK